MKEDAAEEEAGTETGFSNVTMSFFDVKHKSYLFKLHAIKYFPSLFISFFCHFQPSKHSKI